MPRTEIPPYPVHHMFPLVELPPKPETPLPQNPFAPPPKETRPLAASPQPAKFYSQYQCAICDGPIATSHGANFIGNVPCLHRATCTRSSCVRTYYGTSKQWATPYKGRKKLYCQASGCGKEIEGWTLVEARGVPSGKWVSISIVQDPEAQRKHCKAEEKVAEEDRREREREQRKREKERCGGDYLTGSKAGDCCLGCVLCSFGRCWLS
ncbi:hypothetical protein VTI74DRAFT_10466 [Chaetomium olivicolor]